jgi:hypothetical protein
MGSLLSAGAEAPKLTRCCANFACKRAVEGLQVPGAHAVDIFFTGNADKVWARILSSHERSL